MPKPTANPTTTPHRVLGIDPGTLRMGYGVVEEDTEPAALAYGCIEPGASLPVEQRLVHILDRLAELIEQWKPAAVAVEEPFVARGEGANMRTAIAVGQAQAVALIAGARAGLPVHRYTPTAVKRAVVGAGRGEKEQVALMVQVLLRLPEPPAPLDASDALAVALCHLQARRVDALSRME